MCILLVTI